jgi:putative hemolysin
MMMTSYTEIIIFALGLIASGFYSGSEAALMSLSVDRTKQLIEEGGSKGKALYFLVDKPSDILTTILVGNNLVNIFVASYATNIANRYFASDAMAIAVGITTIFILIFGEIIPKTFARAKAETLAVPIIRILQLNYYLLYPVIKIFMFIITSVLGDKVQLNGRVVTKEDLEYMVSKAEREKSIDSKQIDLLNSILEFPTIKVKDIMVSRVEVKGFKKETSYDEIIEVIRQEAHSRYPVYNEDLDHTIGFLHVKDLAFVTEVDKEEGKFDVTRYLKEPFFVYEHMKIQAVFDHMNRKKVHLALVKDENGLVVGIITLEDIMEEIFGEIQDEHDDDEDDVNSNLIQMKEGIVVDAKISLRDLYNDYDVKIPLNDNYSTLTGFILERLGNNFPKEGYLVIWENYSFELTKVIDNEIIEITIKVISFNQEMLEELEVLEEQEKDNSVNNPTEDMLGAK